MALSGETRKLIRTVIKQVHPDLFPSNPYERQANAESLKVGLPLHGTSMQQHRPTKGACRMCSRHLPPAPAAARCRRS